MLIWLVFLVIHFNAITGVDFQEVKHAFKVLKNEIKIR